MDAEIQTFFTLKIYLAPCRKMRLFFWFFHTMCEIVKDDDLLKQQFQLLQSIAQKIRYLKKTFYAELSWWLKSSYAASPFKKWYLEKWGRRWRNTKNRIHKRRRETRILDPHLTFCPTFFFVPYS